MEQLDKYFKGKKRHVTIGVEAEMYLYNAETGSLLENIDEDTDLLNECFAELPDTVTKDFNNYQLEVRTRPHDNPEALIEEFKETLLLCRKVFAKRGVEIKPLSWLGGSETYNGLHIHLKNGVRTLYQTSMFNMYPFVLALTDCFKNSVSSANEISRRFNASNHLGFPTLHNLSRRLIGEQRYKDLIVNGYTENTRHRLKREPTIEIRTFDIPFNFEYFKNLIKLVYNLFAHINSEEQIKPDTDAEIKEKLIQTREDIRCQRHGYNFLFDTENKHIYKYLCKKFKLEELVVPVTMLKSNPIKNRSNLQENWRKLGTKVWLGEDKLDIKPKKEATPTPPIREATYAPVEPDEEEIIEA